MNHAAAYGKWFQDNWFDSLVIIVVTGLLYTIGVTLLGTIVRKAVAASVRGKNWHRKDIEKRQNTLANLFTNIWRVVILIIGGFILFAHLFGPINLAPLFASAGVFGVALGFGAQSLVKDFLSGVFIISENQYRIGDIIEINGDSGTVEHIGTRSTVIRDADGNVHYFPNGTIQHVVNKTMGYSMARFTIAVQPSSDLEQVIDVINQTGQKLGGETKWRNKIIDAPAFVSMGEFTGTSVSLNIAGKTQPSDQWAVVAEMRRRLFEAFEAHDILLVGAAAPVADKPKKK